MGAGGQRQLETKQEQHKKFRILPNSTFKKCPVFPFIGKNTYKVFFCKHMNLINRNVQYQRSSSVGGVGELVKYVVQNLLEVFFRHEYDPTSHLHMRLTMCNLESLD